MKAKKKSLKKAKKLGKKNKRFFSAKEIEEKIDLKLRKIIKKEKYRKEAAKGIVFLATFLILFALLNFLITLIPNFILSIENAIAMLILAILK